MLNHLASRLIHDYLPSRKQRWKFWNIYITWMETVFRDTEGSILRSLLFDIFLADPFFIISNIDIASYPDIYTPYIAADNTDGRSVHVLLKWFDNNHCVKSVQIGSFFWSVFCPNAGKYGPEKTSYLYTFQAVNLLKSNTMTRVIY